MSTNRADVKETPDAQILEWLKETTTYESGFRTLIVKYQERLYFHIRRMVIDHADADDVLQNTFMKVHKGIHHFREQSGLFTWLYRIATNEALSFLQNKKRKGTDALDGQSAVMQQLPSDAFFDGDAVQTQLYAAVETLPDKQRAVFHMRYFDEMPYEDIAQITGTSVGALKASYHHAVKKIESFFKKAII